jgi:hypothetical protein
VNDLATVDWGSLTHAYGPAGDLPDQLRALASADPSMRARAREELDSRVCHQGSRFEASAHVAPFLIDLAGDPATPDRPGVLRLLAALAIGFDRWWLPATYPVAEVRRDVGRKARLTLEELQRELDDWVAGAPTGRIRAARALDAESREVTEERDAERWAPPSQPGFSPPPLMLWPGGRLWGVCAASSTWSAGRPQSRWPG